MNELYDKEVEIDETTFFVLLTLFDEGTRRLLIPEEAYLCNFDKNGNYSETVLKEGVKSRYKNVLLRVETVEGEDFLVWFNRSNQTLSLAISSKHYPEDYRRQLFILKEKSADSEAVDFFQKDIGNKVTQFEYEKFHADFVNRSSELKKLGKAIGVNASNFVYVDIRSEQHAFVTTKSNAELNRRVKELKDNFNCHIPGHGDLNFRWDGKYKRVRFKFKDKLILIHWLFQFFEHVVISEDQKWCHWETEDQSKLLSIQSNPFSDHLDDLIVEELDIPLFDWKYENRTKELNRVALAAKADPDKLKICDLYARGIETEYPLGHLVVNFPESSDIASLDKASSLFKNQLNTQSEFQSFSCEPASPVKNASILTFDNFDEALKLLFICSNQIVFVDRIQRKMWFVQHKAGIFTKGWWSINCNSSWLCAFRGTSPNLQTMPKDSVPEIIKKGEKNLEAYWNEFRPNEDVSFEFPKLKKNLAKRLPMFVPVSVYENEKLFTVLNYDLIKEKPVTLFGYPMNTFKTDNLQAFLE